MNLKNSAVLRAMAFMFSIGLVIFAGGVVTSATTLTVGNATSGSCPHLFTTIQSAVTAASANDTIQVCPGTYPELVTVDKTLTILGAQATVDARTRTTTNESIVGSPDGAFQIEADNVVIDGFTIEGVNNPPNEPPFTGLGAGIWTNPGFSSTHGGHQIRNNIIQNNIIGIELDNDGTIQTRVEQNLIQNNNQAGPDGGTGVDTNFGLNNGVITNNKIVGNTFSGVNDFAPANSGLPDSNITISTNEFTGNRRAVGWFFVTSSFITSNNIHDSVDSGTADIRFVGLVSGVQIDCNNLENGAGMGMWFDNAFAAGPNSNVTANDNNISGYPIAGLRVDSGTYSGTLNATNNWWGSSTGPTIASNPGGTGEPIIDPDGVVLYHPFLTNPSSCAPFINIVTMGPQAMEGDLKVHPGDTLKVGYDFTMPGNHAAATVSFKNSKVTFQYTCVSGPGSGTFVVNMADQSYSDLQNSSAWLPSGDQKSPLTFQGSRPVPDACSGGMVRLQKGGTFSTIINSTDHTDKASIRWHYSANGSAGGWSSTQSVIPR